MKRFILPIALFLLFLLFPLNISAQPLLDNYQMAKDKCFKKKYDECNRKYQSDSCGSNVGANYAGWAACQESLLDKIEKCDEEIASEYQPCKEAEAESLRRKEQYQSQPSEQDQTESDEQESGQQGGADQGEDTAPQKAEEGAKSAKDINDWINDIFGDVDFERIVTGPELERAPVIDELPSPALEKARADSPYSAGILKKEGDVRAEIQYPGTKTFVPMKPGKIPLGSVIKSGDDAIYLYDDMVGMIILPPGAEMTIPDTNLVPVYLEKGTVEVKKDTTSSSVKSPGIGTEFVNIDVIGTHYWVSHEPSKQTLVGVYAGQVELKTKDGKTVTVSPDGDNPGVIVVSQKLSPLKLGIAGVILAAIVSAGFLVWKRKFNLKSNKKKI